MNLAPRKSQGGSPSLDHCRSLHSEGRAVYSGNGIHGGDRMTSYIFAYHGGETSAGPVQSAKQRNAFTDWIARLGDAVVNPGTPLTRSRTVSSSGSFDTAESNRLIGYSIIKARSIDAALELAKQCPFLQIGTIEVAEVMEM